MRIFDAPVVKKALENIVGKKENAGNQSFPFTLYVFVICKTSSMFLVTYYQPSANAFISENAKILSSGKGLKPFLTEGCCGADPIALAVKTINPFPNDKFTLSKTERFCRLQFQI